MAGTVMWEAGRRRAVATVIMCLVGVWFAAVRARRSFWTLVVVAALSMSALSSALKAHPSHVTGATVAVSGAALAICLTLATRVLLALDHARRTARQRPRTEQPPSRAR
jgi:hypothetical protein